MAPWQAFILGILVALVILSIFYGCLIIEAQEKAYKKGLRDGKNRKSDGGFPGMREVTKGTRNM